MTSSGYGYGNQGFGSRSIRPRNEPPATDPVPIYARDPLTDSAVQRGIGMGNVARFHLWGEHDPVDVHVVDIIGVASWREVADYVRNGLDLEVRPPRCMLIKGNAYRWVELVPPEDQ